MEFNALGITDAVEKQEMLLLLVDHIAAGIDVKRLVPGVEHRIF